ncbi:hemolysin III family protein [Glaciecola sp. SC05]|uniref:PAQR family membrane homeostasis protein TrhA n=1 Tax=Glaciecola sp. SC05 TaxID=1987355 RepID=UPI0035273FD5
MLPHKSNTMDHSSYSRSEEWMNTLTHAIGAVLAAIGLVLLIRSAENTIALVTAWVYGISLLAMFLSSSIYHSTVNSIRRAWLRKIDHIAIYLLIAGTYTPFMALSVKGQVGNIGLAVIWAIAIAGILFKMLLGHKYPKISIITYAIMGWMALFFIYPIYQALPTQGFVLLFAGGLCYSAGIPLYLMKNRHYSHALWHVCVAAGAACHFFSIYYYVYPSYSLSIA